MTAPAPLGWEGDPFDANDAVLDAAFEGGFGPLVLGDFPNALTTAEESLANIFSDDEDAFLSDAFLIDRIHAARGDDDSIDIFAPAEPSIWQRIKDWWRDLTGPVPGDGGASVSGGYYPWGML